MPPLTSMQIKSAIALHAGTGLREKMLASLPVNRVDFSAPTPHRLLITVKDDLGLRFFEIIVKESFS